MSDVKSKMEKTVASMDDQLSTLRTGRANPDILKKIQVDYYGSMVPIQQVANISVPEPMVLMLNVFDRQAVQAIERAIMTSDLNLNPQSDGSIIRLRLPDLTEDRRKELVKLAKKIAEDGKVALRNIRRDAIEKLKQDEKLKQISEDEAKSKQEGIQKLTDSFTEKINGILSEKEKEIMKI